MKKIAALAFLCLITLSGRSQDSIRVSKNEIGINLVPAIAVLNGSLGHFVNNKLQYKRRINSNIWYKASVAFISNRNSMRQFAPDYYITAETDTTRSVKYSFNNVGNEFNISQGIEYRFGKKKIRQFTGADLGYARSTNYDIDKYGVYKKDFYNNVTKSGGDFDFKNNILDSTITRSSTKFNSIVLTPFYGARFNITNRLVFSMQLGVTFKVGFAEQKFDIDNSNSNPDSQRFTNFDFTTSGLLNDFSLFYRF
ncbi:MAG TPA: hypothetical protein VGF30_01795 [Bacteroidia bacterium]